MENNSNDNSQESSNDFFEAIKSRDILRVQNNQELGRGLLSAVGVGHLEMVEFLLNNGADVNYSCGNSNMTALIFAAEENYKEIAKLLIERNADMNVVCRWKATAFMIAVSLGYPELVELLINEGAEVKLVADNVIGQSRWIALHEIAKKGYTALAHRLIDDYGADVNLVDDYKKTALMLAADEGHTTTVKLLLDRGAEVNLINRYGETALINAAGGGHTAIVKLLVNKNAELDQISNTGATALINSARGGHTAIAELLINKGASLDRSNDDNTALNQSVSRGHAPIVNAIIIATVANLAAEPYQAKLGLLMKKLSSLRVQDLLNRRAVTLLAIMLEDNQPALGLRNLIIHNFNERNPNQPFSQEANSLFSNLHELGQRLETATSREAANSTLANLLQGDNLSDLSNYYFPRNHNQNYVLTHLNEVEPIIRSFFYNNPRLPEGLNIQISQVIADFFHEKNQAVIDQFPANQTPALNQIINLDEIEPQLIGQEQQTAINVITNSPIANNNTQINAALINNDNQPDPNILPNHANAVLERCSRCAIS